MRKVSKYVWIALIGASLAASPADAQSTHRNGTTNTSTRSSRGNSVSRSEASPSGRPGGSAVNSRPGNSGAKPTNATKPTNSVSSARPGANSSVSSAKPANGNSRPGNNAGNSNFRPGNNGNNNSKPGNNNRPGNNNNYNRPGNSGGNSNNRPGHSTPTTPNPGGNHGHNPGASYPRPGGGAIPARPSNSLPRPGAGGAPASRPTPPPPPAYRPPVAYRWERPLPPPPPRYSYVRVGVPSIGSILGLTFGSLIDYGIASLINAGYNVASTYGNNTVYLTNVAQFGITWPQATLFYNNGGLAGARFQYGSYSPTDYRFNTAYSQLTMTYGNPVEMVYNNGWPVATWWGGNNTGYITLQYGPGVTNTGATMYYTDLIYGN